MEISRPGRFNLFTIPVNRAFADALAAGLLRQHGGAPLALARGLVLLPNNRAVTAVRDAFVRLSGEALLLPRLVALGESDLEGAAGAGLDRMDVDPAPAVIDPVQRRLLMAAVLRKAAPERATSLPEALRLADSLARTLDALTFEERSAADLLTLQDDTPGLAEHWDVALDLVHKVAALWPDILSTLGLTDRADARNRMLDRTAAVWSANGLPAPWVAAAGITVSAPAVARLLKVIATAPAGMVVMPHLDLAMPDDLWAKLGPDPHHAGADDPAPLDVHPQYHLKLLLERMDAGRGDVEIWPDLSAADGPEGRVPFISAMMAPAEATKNWPTLPATMRKLDGVRSFVCPSPAAEALTIALALREVLETPGKTAALVTPDRAIAQRVVGHLTRWGIAIDDSAGTPLPETPSGAFLIALAKAGAARFAPVSLLNILAHPLVRADADERRAWLDRVRQLDLALRGPAPPTGLGGITQVLRNRAKDNRPHEDALLGWWLGVAEILAPLDGDQALPFSDMLAKLLSVFDMLVGAAGWAGAAGRALSDRIGQIAEHSETLAEPLEAGDMPALLTSLLQDVAVRPPQGGHPRLFIWGLIEARLQRADRMILGGLNEGQWPQRPAPDPWLAPGIRRRLGLPGLERQIGLASHDFASALGAPEVIITRSERDGTAPTIASRLVLRIDALAGPDRPGTGALDLCRVAEALDAAGDARPVSRPAPNPPADVRPGKISASKLDLLLADPYAWYAQTVLRLNRLEALEDVPTAMWRGNMVHDLLERWLKSDDVDVDSLERMARDRFSHADVSALLRTLWAPRIMAALRWAGEEIVANRAQGRVPRVEAAEERGEILVGTIRLSGKADRIDEFADGSLAVIDYKTGNSPGKAAVAAGFALQLGLLGAIVEQGGIAGVQGPVRSFEYWRLNKQRQAGRGQNDAAFGWIDLPFYSASKGTVQAEGFVDFALRKLGEAEPWISGDRPFNAKLRPDYAPYTDYDQLMRLDEWYGTTSADGDSA